MSELFGFLAFVSFLALIVGLIKPSWLRMPSRKRVGMVFGGATLYYFALALTIGICFGIYSSVLVASPLVMWLGVSREHFIKPVKKIEGANDEGAVV